MVTMKIALWDVMLCNLIHTRY